MPTGISWNDRQFQQDLFDLNQVMLDLSGKELPGTLVEVMSVLLYNMVEFASGIAPYWTGTLSRSHRGEIENLPGEVIVYLYLDPTSINPVTGGRPVDYGPLVHESQPWIDWTVEWLLEDILIDTEDFVIEYIREIIMSVGSGPELSFSV